MSGSLDDLRVVFAKMRSKHPNKQATSDRLHAREVASWCCNGANVSAPYDYGEGKVFNTFARGQPVSERVLNHVGAWCDVHTHLGERAVRAAVRPACGQ